VGQEYDISVDSGALWWYMLDGDALRSAGRRTGKLNKYYLVQLILFKDGEMESTYLI